DTPGSNENIEEHGRITQTVVEQEADAAVIIIPAGQPVSDTLINFLSGQLYQYIHRCVFVITKMDTIRQREQPRLIKTIQKRLRDKLKIERLFTIETAPQIVIDIITGEEEVEEKYMHWNNKFLEVEEKLQKYLGNSREIVIAESVERLLTQVFRQSESHLQEQQKNFKKEQAALEKEIIKDLPLFTSEQYSECSTMIQNVADQTQYEVNKLVMNCQENTKSQLHNLIYSTTDKGELKTALEKKVSPIFNNAHSILDQELKNAIEKLNQSFGEVQTHFDRKFAKQYDNLRSLSTRVNMNQQWVNSNNIQVSNSSVMSVASELSKTAGDSSNVQLGLGAGAGTGAAIGTIILPGVGTFVGAALGSLFGSIIGSFFGPSLSELQNSSWNELKPKIQDYFDSAEKAVEKYLESYSQQMIKALTKHIDVYIETYQKIVEAMQQEQREKKENLSQLQKAIEADLLEINNRINSLEKSKTSLVNNY
ncbi:MAG: glycine zipper domain-containing protein, partial [Xenococcus sp. (in: cyanobacteria)]